MAETEKQNAPASASTDAPQEKSKPKWKKVVSIVLTVILVAFLVGGLFLVIQTKRTGAPFLFGYATYYVVSGSMEPTIMTNDVIIVKKLDDPSSLKVGDIVTYRAAAGAFKNLAAGTPVTHRIIKIDGDTITTQGDNHAVAPMADKPISRKDVLGTYVRTSSFLSGLYKVFSSKYGFLFLVFIPLLVLLGVQIFNFRRACRMDKDGKMPEEKTAEEIKEQAVKEKEAEIKRKAIEDYLASKKRLEKAAKENNTKKSK